MLLNLLLLLLPIYQHFPCISADTSISNTSSTTKPGCAASCGDLTVPYPFGIVGSDSSCAVDPFFTITCNTSFDPPKAFLNTNDTIQILGIFDTKIHVKNQVAFTCYDANGSLASYTNILMNLSSTPFTVSDQNKLTVVGCDDVAYVTVHDYNEDDYSDYISSCVAVCSKPEDLSDGVCFGIGCCEAAMSKGLQYVYATTGTMNYHIKVHNFSSCGYAFLAEENAYIFKESDISDSSFLTRAEETMPLVLDWAIGNQNCSGEIICQRNSVCVDSGTNRGYRCNCSQGFQGNPYLVPGYSSCSLLSNILGPPSVKQQRIAPESSSMLLKGIYYSTKHEVKIKPEAFPSLKTPSIVN